MSVKHRGGRQQPQSGKCVLCVTWSWGGEKTCTLPELISDDASRGNFSKTWPRAPFSSGNNARPTSVSPPKTLASQRRKSGRGSRRTCLSSLKPAQYSQKHLLPRAYWSWEVTVFDTATGLVCHAVVRRQRGRTFVDAGVLERGDIAL